MLPRLGLLWSLSSKDTQCKCHPSDPLYVSPWGCHLVTSSCSSNAHLWKGTWQQRRARTHHKAQEQMKMTPLLSSPPLSSQLLYCSQCRDMKVGSACSFPTTSSAICCMIFSGWIWMNWIHPTQNTSTCSSCLPQDTRWLLSHTSGSLLLVFFHFEESQFHTSHMSLIP